jgi:ribosomal protein S18 acetylase RimI-like enzyme
MLTMFELQYESLIINEKLKPWDIAVIPWDTETFGFGVATLNPYDIGSQYTDAGSIDEALKVYSKDKQVRVITATIDSEQNETSLLLQRSGFRFIDMSLSVHYDNLKDISTQGPCGLSLAQYHMDSSIEKSLADQRYNDWISRCLEPESQQQVLAVKFNDEICGFSVIELKGPEGYLHLHALDSKWRGKKLGSGMILESMKYLHDLGAETAGTKISVSNLNALNMHSRLNGRFTTAERLLHWHKQKE